MQSVKQNADTMETPSGKSIAAQSKEAKSKTDTRLTYDPKEFMAITGLSKTAVYQGIDRGEIPSIRIGRRILIPRSAVEKMFDVVAA